MIDKGLPIGILFSLLIVMAMVLALGAVMFIDIDLGRWLPASVISWMDFGQDTGEEETTDADNKLAKAEQVPEEISPTPSPVISPTITEPRALAVMENIGLPSGLVANPYISLTPPVLSVFEKAFVQDEPHMTEEDYADYCNSFGVPGNRDRCFRFNRACAEKVPKREHNQCLEDEGY